MATRIHSTDAESSAIAPVFAAWQALHAGFPLDGTDEASNSFGEIESSIVSRISSLPARSFADLAMKIVAIQDFEDELVALRAEAAALVEFA